MKDYENLFKQGHTKEEAERIARLNLNKQYAWGRK